jgi:hypothetical protein
MKNIFLVTYFIFTTISAQSQTEKIITYSKIYMYDYDATASNDHYNERKYKEVNRVFWNYNGTKDIKVEISGGKSIVLTGGHNHKKSYDGTPTADYYLVGDRETIVSIWYFYNNFRLSINKIAYWEGKPAGYEAERKYYYLSN